MLIAQKNVLLAGLLVISSVRIAKGAPAAEDPEEEVLSACQLPKDVGDCDKNVTKYYFNSESEECEEFTFGGCNGNDNKFDSMEECSEACKKDSEDENKSNAYRMGFDPEEDYDRKEGFLGDPQDPRFRDLRPYRPAPFYYRENSDERLGLGFYGYPKPYGHIGHPQHRNNFEEFEPENKWGLLNYFAGYPYGGNNNLLVEDKRRQAALGYNRGPEDNDKKFSYNGFSGFNPEALSKPVISVCSQPRKSGRCFNNSFQRFYYDSRLGKCIRFSYNGCGGNQNNFETYNDCVQTCARLFYKSKKNLGFYGNTEDKKYGYYGGGSKKHGFGAPGFFSRNQLGFQNLPHYRPHKKIAEEEYKENIEPYSNQDNYLTSIFFKKQGSVYLPVVPFTPEHISNAYKSINVDKDELEETSNNKENKESSSPDEVDEITSTISKEGKLFKLLKTATMDSSKDDKEEENDDEEDDLEKGEDDEEEEEGEEDIEEDMGEDTEVDICSLPLKTGNCKAGVERYFFDLDKNECLKFSYRGCDKNANNFETMRDCEIKCIISKKGSKSSREK